MLKSIQIKVVMIFMVLGIVVITALGLIFIYQLNFINTSITGNATGAEEVHLLVTEQMNQTKTIILISLIIFSGLIVILGIFIARVIIAPISNLIKSAELIAKGKNVDIEYLGEGKRRSEIDDLVSAFSLMNTELKENLNEATRQKKQMETILLHMTDGIVAFNIEGKIIHINPAAKVFLDLETDEELEFEEIFYKFNVDINLEKIIYLENWTSSEKRININDRTINLFFAPFKNENDRPAGVIVVIQDITEHMKLDNMRKEFIADVSHELKTPITSILGYADTLVESDIDNETKNKFLERISSEAERMAKLVSDLLILSKYDTSKVKIEKTDFDVGELVKEIFDGLDIEMKKKNQNGECFVTSDVPLVYADRMGIERAVLNVFTNAIKYTNEGGTIKAYIGCVYNDVYIKIIDNGIGIPREDLDKVFERFYRVDKARTREMGGTGLRTFNSKRNTRPK